jgi:predicted RNase H-like HicB family nuclease
MQLIDIKIKFPVRIQKRKRWVVASCPPLDLHSQGENQHLAIKNLKETLSLFMTSCMTKKALREIENQIDIEDAKKAIKEKESIPWEKAKAELEL